MAGIIITVGPAATAGGLRDDDGQDSVARIPGVKGPDVDGDTGRVGRVDANRQDEAWRGEGCAAPGVAEPQPGAGRVGLPIRAPDFQAEVTQGSGGAGQNGLGHLHVGYAGEHGGGGLAARREPLGVGGG